METIPHLGLFALALLLGSATRWFWRAMQVNVPESFNLYKSLWITGLVLGGIAYYQNPNDPFAPSAIGIGLLLVYLIFTGGQRMSSEAIAVGDSLPHFTAVDADDNPFDSISLEGKRVLLKFFRGHW